MDVNPYEVPHEFNAALVALEPTDFRPWRLFLAFHLTLVIATLIATLLDMGYFGRLGAIPAPGFQFLFSALFFAVTVGVFVHCFVAPIAIVILFVRAITHDKRYALAAVSELLLTAAHFFIVLPMCQ